jgi:hypothetical protein
MYKRYTINLDDYSLDTPIYRIVSYDTFLEALINGELTLVKPRLWDDPFEEFLAKQNFRGPNGENYTMKNFGSNFFGQCWSLDYESDFMWRVYSKNHQAIKIKSSIKSLINGLKSEIAENDVLKIGKVDYWNNEKIKMNFGNAAFLGDLLAKGFYHSLFIKKESFRHENEVRIIYSSGKNEEAKNTDLFKIGIDPNFLFHEIEFHPRLSMFLREDIERTIRKLGFKNRICYSELYSVPELNLNFHWKR